MNRTPEIIRGPGFEAEVVRSDRRKTVTIKVEEGKVSILVPRRADTDRIAALIDRKTRWIREKLLLQRQHPPPKPKEYVSGESFTYLGRNYRLKVESGPGDPVRLQGGRLMVRVPPATTQREPYVQAALTAWYRARAAEKLGEKVARYAGLVGRSPTSVRIRTYKSRWGSCSAKGDIQFNWKIIIAPNRIVDYVVVHELCHLRRHDHSPEFWKCVERVLPDYAERKEWLKLKGRSLEV